jgi:hypothetical protein
VGLAETRKFADGYEAIFGKKTKEAAPPTARAAAKKAAGTKKPAAKPKPATKKAPAKKTTKKKA